MFSVAYFFHSISLFRFSSTVINWCFRFFWTKNCSFKYQKNTKKNCLLFAKQRHVCRWSFKFFYIVYPSCGFRLWGHWTKYKWELPNSKFWRMYFCYLAAKSQLKLGDWKKVLRNKLGPSERPHKFFSSFIRLTRLCKIQTNTCLNLFWAIRV